MNNQNSQENCQPELGWEEINAIDEKRRMTFEWCVLAAEWGAALLVLGCFTYAVHDHYTYKPEAENVVFH